MHSIGPAGVNYYNKSSDEIAAAAVYAAKAQKMSNKIGKAKKQ